MTAGDPLELVVLVSGSGTNLQAVIDAIAQHRLHARVRLVLSNVEGAKGLERAQQAGIDTRVLPHKGFATRAAFDTELTRMVRDAFGAADDQAAPRRWVLLAGFMRIVGASFLDSFAQRVINIHPSLLPAFPGVHAQRQALDKRVRVTGCTVHLVDAGTDTGPILGQAAVPVLDDDDETTLTARILEQEHRLLPSVLQWIAEGRLRMVDGRPRFDGVVPVLGLAR